MEKPRNLFGAAETPSGAPRLPEGLVILEIQATLAHLRGDTRSAEEVLESIRGEALGIVSPNTDQTDSQKH